MPEGFQGKIDTSQAQISGVEKKAEAKEETAELKAKLQEHHNTFFGSVDGTQSDITKAMGELQDPNNKGMLKDFGSEIQMYLQQVATAGEQIYQAKINDKEAAGLSTISEKARVINDLISEIKQHIPALKAMEESERAYNEKAKPAMDEVQRIMDDMQLNPVEKKKQILEATDKSVDELAEAKKILKKVPITSVPDVMRPAYEETEKFMNDGLEEMAKIKTYYEVRDFAKSDRYRQYFAFNEETGEITSTEAFRKLPEEGQQRILMELHAVKKKIIDEIEAKCAVSEEEKAFYEGKELLASGDWIGAKAALLTFVNGGEVYTEDAQRIPEAKELLKQIALMELSQAQLQLNLLKSSIEAQFAGLTTGKLEMGVDHMTANLFLKDMEAVMAQAREMIESGEVLTIEGVRSKLRKLDAGSTGPLRRFQMGFQSKEGGKMQYNLSFDVLRTQARLNNESDPRKRGQMMLAEAKKARDAGLPDLARHYYDMYYQEDLARHAKKVSRNEIAIDLATDSDAQAQLNSQMSALRTQVIAEYQKKHGREPTAEELNGILKPQKQKIMNMMVERAYSKAVKASLHREMMASGSNKGQEWRTAYGNTFINLDTHETKWYRAFYKFSDAEWNEFKTMIWVDIAFMVAGGGAGGVIAKGIVGRKISAALVKKGLTQAAVHKARSQGELAFAKFVIRELGVKKAAAYGVTSLAVESGATNIVNGTLSGAVRGDFSMYSDPATFFKGWGRMAVMMGAGKVNNLGFSFRKAPQGALKRAAGGLGMVAADETLMTAFELGLMAMTGEQITSEKVARIIKDNIVYAVGLRGANRLTGRLQQADEAGVSRESEPSATKPAEVTTAALKRAPKPSAAKPAPVLRPAFARSKAPKVGEPGKAAETHYYSRFAADIPEPMRAKGKKAENVAGWIGEDGRINMSGPYFKKRYGVELRTNEKGENTFVIEKTVDGKKVLIEMNALEFARSAEGKAKIDGRTLLQEMVRVKRHEVTHRVLEAIQGQSGGKLGEAVKKLIQENPEIGALFGKDATPSFKNVQEFISQIADGRIKLSEVNQRRLEKVIGEFIPKFKFSRIRIIDTQLILRSKPEEVTRVLAAAMEEPRIGDKITFGKYAGYFFVSKAIGDTVVVSKKHPSQYDAMNPPADTVFTVNRAELNKPPDDAMERAMTQQREASQQKGYKVESGEFKGWYVHGRMTDGKILIAKTDPSKGGTVIGAGGHKMLSPKDYQIAITPGARKTAPKAKPKEGGFDPEKVPLYTQIPEGKYKGWYIVGKVGEGKFRIADRNVSDARMRGQRTHMTEVTRAELITRPRPKPKPKPKLKPGTTTQAMEAVPVPLTRPKQKPARNEVQRPPEEVPRDREVMMVGDLHGNAKAAEVNFKTLGIIDQHATLANLDSVNWRAGNKHVVLHGDILADRNKGSFKIMAAIKKLQAQAREQGGELTLLAGNHEDFATQFLTGLGHAKNAQEAFISCIIGGEQGAGLHEFMRFSNDPMIKGSTNLMDVYRIMTDQGKNATDVAQDILAGMRSDPEGRAILETMASMKIAEYRDDTLFVHTNMTPDMMKMLEQSGATIGEAVDKINSEYQKFLRAKLLGEDTGADPGKYEMITDVFLHTGNRPMEYAAGSFATLKARGLNRVVHGHTYADAGEVIRTPDGVEVMSVDQAAGKGGDMPQHGERSVGIIDSKGRMRNGPGVQPAAPVTRDLQVQRSSVKEGIHALAEGKMDTGNAMHSQLMQLHQRDPEGYRLLRANVDSMSKVEIDAILEGRTNEFVDGGKRIKFYILGRVGQGIEAHVDRIMYTVDGSTKPEYAVVRTPRGGKPFSQGNMDSIKYANEQLDHPIINKALFMDPGGRFMVLEEAVKPLKYENGIDVSTPEQGFRMLHELLSGYNETFARNGALHLDLHFGNVMVVQNPDGTRSIKITDNGNIAKMGDFPPVLQARFMHREYIQVGAYIEVAIEAYRGRVEGDSKAKLLLDELEKVRRTFPGEENGPPEAFVTNEKGEFVVLHQAPEALRKAVAITRLLHQHLKQ
ncbi:hypothetical protein ACFL2V_04410 [Pseudomonadota bacterium]